MVIYSPVGRIISVWRWIWSRSSQISVKVCQINLVLIMHSISYGAISKKGRLSIPYAREPVTVQPCYRCNPISFIYLHLSSCSDSDAGRQSGILQHTIYIALQVHVYKFIWSLQSLFLVWAFCFQIPWFQFITGDWIRFVFYASGMGGTSNEADPPIVLSRTHTTGPTMQLNWEHMKD